MLPLGLVALLAASPLGTLLVAGATASTFAEELTLRPLADGKVDALFSFAISSTSDGGASCECFRLLEPCVELRRKEGTWG